MSSKCPKCGADRHDVGEGIDTFVCESFDNTLTGSFHQSLACRANAAEAKVRELDTELAIKYALNKEYMAQRDSLSRRLREVKEWAGKFYSGGSEPVADNKDLDELLALLDGVDLPTSDDTKRLREVRYQWRRMEPGLHAGELPDNSVVVNMTRILDGADLPEHPDTRRVREMEETIMVELGRFCGGPSDMYEAICRVREAVTMTIPAPPAEPAPCAECERLGRQMLAVIDAAPTPGQLRQVAAWMLKRCDLDTLSEPLTTMILDNQADDMERAIEGTGMPGRIGNAYALVKRAEVAESECAAKQRVIDEVNEWANRPGLSFGGKPLEDILRDGEGGKA